MRNTMKAVLSLVASVFACIASLAETWTDPGTSITWTYTLSLDETEAYIGDGNNAAIDKATAGDVIVSYKAKKGTFSGSFKVFSLNGGKLKTYKVKVNGVVVDGVGYGIATCKKPSIAWGVTVK